MVAVGVKPLKLVSQLCDILKENISYVCAFYFHVNTVHIAGLISPHLMKKKRKEKKKKSSSSFSSL